MKRIFSLFLSLTLLLLISTIVRADHSWGNYHWARELNPVNLELGDNVTSKWDTHLETASTDWNKSSVLSTSVVVGLSNPKNCKATTGRVEVCNAKYGNNGWLGIAQIWISGDHITKGVTKLNDTYFNTAKYNTNAWRQLVMCQEVGHTFGLDHQDENFNNANLGTCMDYTSDPSTNQHPNQHDYDQLASIYSHLDNFSTVGTVVDSPKPGRGKNMADLLTADILEDPKHWGEKISDDGHTAVFVRDFGLGNKVVTHVTWAN